MARLYDHYVDRVHAVIRLVRATHPPTGPETVVDLTQRTFVALWRTARNRPVGSSLDQWVLGTARSVADEACRDPARGD